MKVAVSSSGKDLNAELDPRFGRCSHFLIIETDNMNVEAFVNENASLGGGAGIQSAQFVASQKVKAVITGNCGHKAMQNRLQLPPYGLSNSSLTATPILSNK